MNANAKHVALTLGLLILIAVIGGLGVQSLIQVF